MTKWTKAAIRSLVDRMRQQGRSNDEIAQEVRTEIGVSPLAAYRQIRGWSQTEVAVRFTEATPGHLLDQATISRLELWPKQGGRAPQAVQIVAFARLYETSPLNLLSAEGFDRLGESERAVLQRVGRPPQPAATESTPRRTVHTPAPAHTCNPERKVEMAARRAVRFGSLVEGATTGPETIQALFDETARIARVYPRVPLNDVLSDLIEAQDVTFVQLEGRQKPSQSKDLYILAGLLSLVLAKASHDTGDPRSAMKQARTAAICAEQAEHPGLMIRVRAQQSLIAYWAGWTSEAARYATVAEDLTDRNTGSGAVWLTAQSARTWAALGDGERAVTALNRAADLRAAMEPDDLDAIGGLMRFASCRQEYYEAETRIWVPGEEEHAKESAQRAVSAYEIAHEQNSDDWAFGDEAGSRADLAFAHACLGEVEGAREVLAPVLDLPVDRRIAGIVRSVMRVHDPLRRPEYTGSTTVRQLREEIDAYVRSPAAGITTGG